MAMGAACMFVMQKYNKQIKNAVNSALEKEAEMMDDMLENMV